MEIFELGYALSKQVRAMRTNVTLNTDYGALVLYGNDAAQVATVVERMLQKKLAQRERLERGQREALD